MDRKILFLIAFLFGVAIVLLFMVYGIACAFPVYHEPRYVTAGLSTLPIGTDLVDQISKFIASVSDTMVKAFPILVMILGGFVILFVGYYLFVIIYAITHPNRK